MSATEQNVMAAVVRRLQDQLEQEKRARAVAEAANRAKSNFLAVTSHEVRTPLNAVLGLAEALKVEPLTPRQASLVDGVLDAGSMLLRLLNSVLDVTRIESGNMTLDREAFDLNRCVKAVVEIWRPRAAERAVALTLHLESGAAVLGVLSDRGKIEQVLINLISNALKFTPVGSRIDVRLAGRVEADGRIQARLEVCDQGPGVPPSERQRIFRPFEQTAAGREAGGAGLGLSICAGHAALLGGEIGVDAAPGGGARFWLTFSAEPAVLTAPTSPHLGGREPSTAPPPVDLPVLRVLAAEDHPANRLVLQALLERAGVVIRFAENGREAVEAQGEEGFDLVLMDVNMPVMDGVSALSAIRALPSPAAKTPVYMLTPNVFEDDVRRYLAAGADGVLKKPIDVRELFALVASLRSAKAMPADIGTMRAAS